MNKTNLHRHSLFLLAFLTTPLLAEQENQLFDPQRGPLVRADALDTPQGNNGALVVRPNISDTLTKAGGLPEQSVELVWRQSKALDDVGQAWDVSAITFQPSKSKNTVALYNSQAQASPVVVARRDTRFDSEALKAADQIACHTRGTTPTSGSHETYWETLARDNRTYGERSCDGTAIELRKLFRDLVIGLEQFTDGYTTNQLQALLSVVNSKLSRNPDTAVGKTSVALIPLIQDLQKQAESLRGPLAQYFGGALQILGNVVETFDQYIDDRTDPFPGYKLRDSVMDHVENTDFGTHDGGVSPTAVRISVERIDITEIVRSLNQVLCAMAPLLSRKMSERQKPRVEAFLKQVDHLNEEKIEGHVWSNINNRRQKMGLPPIQSTSFAGEIQKLAKPIGELLPMFQRIDQTPVNQNLEPRIQHFMEGIRRIESTLGALKDHLNQANMVLTTEHDLQLLQEDQTPATHQQVITVGSQTFLPSHKEYVQKALKSTQETAKKNVVSEAENLQTRVSLIEQYLSKSSQPVITGRPTQPAITGQ